MSDKILELQKRVSRLQKQLDNIWVRQARMCENCAHGERCGGGDCEEIDTQDGDSVYYCEFRITPEDLAAREADRAYQAHKDREV